MGLALCRSKSLQARRASLVRRLSVGLLISCPTSCGPSTAGSPSRGGNVMVYVFDIKPTELAHSFYSVLVSVSVFMALSPIFHSINSPDNSPLSHSVVLV